MWDLWLGVVLVAVLAAGLFAVTVRQARAAGPRALTAVAGVTVALIVVGGFPLRDSLQLARWLPWADLIVLGNGVPLVGAVLAGAVWCGASGSRVRRGAVVAALTLASFVLAYEPLLGPRPDCADLWSDGVCLQTSPASCSAAAAATLLRAHGIPATEGELARLCLTGRRGTTRQGLYRGVSLKTAGTAWRVEPLCTTVAGLRANREPALLFVGLLRGERADPRYQRDWGWQPGVSHAVVLLGFRDGGWIEIGDPSVGRERWRAEALDVLWHGEGVRLSPARRAHRPKE